MSHHTRMDASLDEERLADRVAELAERIARGEAPHLRHPGDGDPGGCEAVERLLPAIRLLAEVAGEDSAADDPVSFMPAGDVLGDFRLGREIGRGGIGVVYEAREISMGRRVAIKVLPPSSRLDRRQLRRFENEARVAAALRHPGIVPVVAYGIDRGVPYIAMPLIDGQNLAEVVAVLRRHEGCVIPPPEAAELARQAAEALDFAHRHDVLHRDIKPSNLLVDRGRRLWIADFGLARVRDGGDLTATGDVIGTLRYLSPEQARGRRGSVDGRSDVYGLGATLYELLTLRPVFQGDDRAELLSRIVSEEARFSRKLDAAIPLDLKTIVLKALARDPAERYATAGEMAEDLARFVAGRPIRARRPTLVSRSRRWARRHGRAAAFAGLFAAPLVLSLAGANARLRVMDRRLADEIARAVRHAREARGQARISEQYALGAKLRQAAQALDAARPDRAREILREIPFDDVGEARLPLAWRRSWGRAGRDIVVPVRPSPSSVASALPDRDVPRVEAGVSRNDRRPRIDEPPE